MKGNLLDSLREESSRNERLAVVLRHSIRESIGHQRDHRNLYLTEEGKQMALDFGRELPRGKLIRIFYSPVSRCRQTAECIKEGMSGDGCSAILVGEREFLNAPFVDFASAIDRMRHVGASRFARMWLNDQVDSEIIKDAHETLQEMTTGVLSNLLEDQKHIDLHIAHDWNIILLRELLLGIRHEDAGWPDFLDGVILSYKKDEISAYYGNVTNTTSWRVPDERHNSPL